VLRPVETGNQGVINEVNANESTVGYADIAVAYEKGFFSAKGKGGEQKKEEQNSEFWAVVQNSEIGKTPVTYADPSSKGDKEKLGESNCKSTVYVAKVGEEFPPKSTRKDWSKVKGLGTSKTYGICGLTYDLAPRQFYPFLKHYGLSQEESNKIATDVHDYLVFVTNAKSGGGQKLLKNSFYNALPKEVQAEAEHGAKEIGNAKG